MGPHPAVAAVRRAVRGSLAGLEPGDRVLVACSGGADSLALAAATAFEAPRATILAAGVTVDHGLQPGSAARATLVAEALTRLGLSPVTAVAVTITGPGGPEAAARAARYAALDEVADSAAVAAVLLGHTLDDQAETVLLRLARGSGARSLAGMAPRSGRYLRPLLGIRREQTRAACAALGLQPWDDPQNADPAFARSRVRNAVMPVLTSALGPGVAEALARTADLLRADAEALDCLTAAEISRLGGTAVALTDGWPVRDLAARPAAIRHRMLRQAALAAGCPPGALSRQHVASLDALVTAWHGQRGADLPGGVSGQRRYGRLLLAAGGGITPRGTPAKDPGVAPRDGSAGDPGVAPRGATAQGAGARRDSTAAARSEELGGRQ